MTAANRYRAGVPAKTRSSLTAACVLLAAVALTASAFIYHEFTTVRAAKLSELTAIADLKAMQVGNWYAERMSDARMLAQSGMMRREAVALLENPGDTHARREIAGWMDAVLQEGGYRLVALYGADGAERCAAPAGSLPPRLAGTVDFQEVVHSGEASETLHREKGRAGEIYFDVLVPVVVQDGSAKSLRGVWLLRIDPRRSLFRLVQPWSTPSNSAETLLVRQDGSDVLFLNDVRHSPQSAGILRRSMDLYPCLAATQVVKGREGTVENQDYRDVPTVAAARRVGGTPWSIVVKVDAEEVYAPLKRTVWITAAVLVLLALSAAAVIAVGNRWGGTVASPLHFALKKGRGERLRTLFSSWG